MRREKLGLFILILALLTCNSCKKSDVSTLQNFKKNINEDIFIDVSELEAKKLVGNRLGNVDKKKLLSSKQLQDLRDLAHLKEAKLADIPIPLSVEPLEEFANDVDVSNQVVLGYSSAMPSEDLFSFYKQEMERLGWQHIASFDEYEKMRMLNFTKPSKFCSVLISKCSCDKKSSQEHSKIIIFTKR